MNDDISLTQEELDKYFGKNGLEVGRGRKSTQKVAHIYKRGDGRSICRRILRTRFSPFVGPTNENTLYTFLAGDPVCKDCHTKFRKGIDKRYG